MKKKIKLRGELVAMMLISLVISFAVAFFIRNQQIGFKENNEQTRMNKIDHECIMQLKEELLLCNLENKEEVENLLQTKYGFLVGYEFYIVDESGMVKMGSNSSIQKIDVTKVVDGMREYHVSKEDRNIFRINGCDYLKDDFYLYYTYLKYDENDTGLVVSGLIGALIIFFFLIWGRISYISTIRASVAQIAKGDLSYRVPCRYKNELRALAEDINYMADALDREEQKKNEFLTNISHDIRTPLTTILGYLAMIRQGRYDSKEELNSYMDIMERKGRFLASMLEDFFQYSKLTSKDTKINEERFELNELLRQFYEDELGEFEAHRLRLELELYQKPIYCKGDTELLARVVNNLLQNALKYSRLDSTVIVKSTMERIEGIDYCLFLVSNIPKEKISSQELELLFDRLYKRDCARSEEGSGLGLSIVKNIVRLHDGIVKCYKEDERLVFKVLLKI